MSELVQDHVGSDLPVRTFDQLLGFEMNGSISRSAALVLQDLRPPSVESREPSAARGEATYRAWRAHQRTRGRTQRAERARNCHPGSSPGVSEWLQEWWVARGDCPALAEFPDDAIMWVSREAIDRALFVQVRGRTGPRSRPVPGGRTGRPVVLGGARRTATT